MSKFVRLCRDCKSKSNEESCLAVCGYSTYLKEDDYTCEDCGGTVIDLKMSVEDYRILIKISTDPKFIESMIQLQESDIIEYESRMSQFRTQVEHQKQQKESQRSNKLQCTYCHSSNVKKITNTSKAVHTAIFGIFSMSRNSKQWHCNNCGTDF